ncbi:hypothetical protein FRY77_00055 [Halomonas sp. MG34]|nr:hypothetical protein [Halomonas sp. MG34]
MPIAAQLEGQLTITPQMDDVIWIRRGHPSLLTACVLPRSPHGLAAGGAEGEQSPEGNPLGGWAA